MKNILTVRLSGEITSKGAAIVVARQVDILTAATVAMDAAVALRGLVG